MESKKEKGLSLWEVKCEPALSEYFEKLMESEILSDITLKIDGKEIRAHKNILVIRSPAFHELILKSPTNIEELAITDVKYEVMKVLLSFIYTGKFPELKSNLVCDTFIAANKYGLPDLKKFCEEAIAKTLDFDNVINYLIFALKFKAEIIKEKSKDLIINNFDRFRGPDFRKILELEQNFFIEILNEFAEKLSESKLLFLDTSRNSTFVFNNNDGRTSKPSSSNQSLSFFNPRFIPYLPPAPANNMKSNSLNSKLKKV